MLKSVIQVIPKEDYTVYVYFSTGEIKLYNARHLFLTWSYEHEDIDS